MAKLAVLKISKNSPWENDFTRSIYQNFPPLYDYNCVLEIREENQPPFVKASGKLGCDYQVLAYFQGFFDTCQSFINNISWRKIEVVRKGTNNLNLSRENVRSSIDNLSKQMNLWLSSPSFQPITNTLFSNLSKDEEIRLLIETNNEILQKLPWHSWDFLKHYHKAEILLSLPDCKTINPISPKDQTNKAKNIRILAIYGDPLNTDINVRKDKQILQQLEENHKDILEIKHIEYDNISELETIRTIICHELDQNSWDILIYSGHTETTPQNLGTIFLDNDKNKNFRVDDIQSYLTTAIQKGLQLAIFNSCQGLGVARQLAEMGLSQSIIMRDKVPDEVAHQFLENFLNIYSSGESLSLSVRKAREKLEQIEDRYPGATWLPIMVQNSLNNIPPKWTDFIPSQCEDNKNKNQLSFLKKSSTKWLLIIPFLIAGLWKFAPIEAEQHTPDTFICDLQNRQLTLKKLTKNNKSEQLLILPDDDFNPSGWTSAERCEAISRRFQELSKNDEMKLTHGELNGSKVICATKSGKDLCTNNNILITITEQEKINFLDDEVLGK